MREILPPEQPHFENYYRYERCFSPPECSELIRLAETAGMHPGSIGNAANQTPIVDTSYRKALTARITPEMAPWAFERVRERIEWVNGQYRFDLNGLYEDIGVMRYDAPESPEAAPGQYRWHQDFGGGVYSRRKISVVSLLSEPTDFDGGDLVLFNQSEAKADLSKRGDMALFPSWTPHCVTPVTRGRRYSLVAWVSGPRFR